MLELSFTFNSLSRDHIRGKQHVSGTGATTFHIALSTPSLGITQFGVCAGVGWREYLLSTPSLGITSH